MESLSLSVLRLLGEEARKDRTSKVIAELPIDVSTYLLNEKRAWLTTIEEREHVNIVIVPRGNLESPHYQLRRVRDDAVRLPENAPVSYMLPESETETSDVIERATRQQPMAQKPAVSKIVPSTPAPTPTRLEQKQQEEKAPGLLARFFALFKSEPEDKAAAAESGKKRRDGRGPGKERAGQRRERPQGRSRQRGRGGKEGGPRKGGEQDRRSGGRNARNEKSPQRDDSRAKPDAAKAGPDEQKSAAQGGDRPPRNRRGGRRRRGGRKRGQQNAGQSQQQDAATSTGNDGKPMSGETAATAPAANKAARGNDAQGSSQQPSTPPREAARRAPQTTTAKPPSDTPDRASADAPRSGDSPASRPAPVIRARGPHAPPRLAPAPTRPKEAASALRHRPQMRVPTRTPPLRRHQRRRHHPHP